MTEKPGSKERENVTDFEKMRKMAQISPTNCLRVVGVVILGCYRNTDTHDGNVRDDVGQLLNSFMKDLLQMTQFSRIQHILNKLNMEKQYREEVSFFVICFKIQLDH